jgi:hypothetical protein
VNLTEFPQHSHTRHHFTTKQFSCASNKSGKCAEMILQNGATPVHFASSERKLEVVRYLIEKCGADANVKTGVSEFV